jgi:hypothetical protein
VPNLVLHSGRELRAIATNTSGARQRSQSNELGCLVSGVCVARARRRNHRERRLRLQAHVGSHGRLPRSPPHAGPISGATSETNVDHLAQEAGVQPDEFADKVSRELPAAIDKATPEGVIPSVQKAASGAFDR